MALIGSIRDFWQRFSLPQQFALAALTVIVPGAIAVGWWIPERINEAVIKNAAAGTVLYMDGLIAPLIPEIKQSAELNASSRADLDNLLRRARADGKVVSIKVWRLDGTVIYSSFPELIGKKFEPSESFLAARDGGLGVAYNEAAHDEDEREQKAGIPLLEVYTPVRDPDSRQIIAISEFYANGVALGKDITNATRLSWAVIGIAAASLIAALSFIVSKASELIAAQRKELQQQVKELQDLLGQNQGLRESLRQANENVTGINEQVLQRVGADLHDGPAQMLAYAMLRLSRIKKFLAETTAGTGAVDEMSKILSDTLRDVRHMSTGLMLPELSGLPLAAVVEKAVKSHSDYTGTTVQLRMTLKRDFSNEALKTCIYRFVQEALTNAFKHAGGKGQAVEVFWLDGIVVKVVDGGAGIRQNAGENDRKGLGLIGMRSRLEAIGGRLEIGKAAGGGTDVTARFPDTIDWT